MSKEPGRPSPAQGRQGFYPSHLERRYRDASRGSMREDERLRRARALPKPPNYFRYFLLYMVLPLMFLFCVCAAFGVLHSLR